MLDKLFLGSLIGSVLGARPKSSRRASQYLTGGVPGLGLGLNLGTLLGAAGLAWGAYEHFKDRSPRVMTTVEGGGFPAASAPPPLPASHPPRLPAEAASTTTTDPPTSPEALRRLVALTIAAARADGELGEEEYGGILASARQHGAEKLVQEEMARRRTIHEIVGGAETPRLREDMYSLAYGIVRADGGMSAGERKWLRELAATLAFDTEAAARIEQETADRIDRQKG